MARILGKTIYFRPRGKSKTLYVEAILPIKEGGRIFDHRVERSTGTSDRGEAEQFAKAMILAAYEALTLPEPVEPVTELLFGQALGVYEQRTGNKRFLLPILDEIGAMPLSDVNQEIIDQMAAKLYPGRAAATLNRQIYTPVSAILKMAESKTFRPPTIKRPKGHLPPSNYVLPPKDWWKRVTDVADPNLAALLWFWRLHGRRTSEACEITPGDIDKDSFRVKVWDGKGKQWISFELSETVVEHLRRYEWWSQQYVFGFSSKSKVYPKLREACEKAGVPYHVPKDAGRHSWASYLLDQGATLKEVQTAGRWKTMKAVEIYAHLEHGKVDAQTRRIGDDWAKEQAAKGELLKPDFPANPTANKKKTS